MKTILQLLVVSFLLCSASAHSVSAKKSYILHNGAVYRVELSSLKTVPVSGRVTAFSYDATGFYYAAIQGQESGGKLLTVGFLKDNSGALPIEKKLPVKMCDFRVERFFCYKGVIFILLRYLKEEIPCDVELIRFNFNTMETSSQTGLIDATINTINEGMLIVLKKRGASFVVSLSGGDVPLLLEGTPRFAGTKGGRLLFITDGMSTEVVDIISRKNVYQYVPGKSPVLPKDYNILIEAIDLAGKGGFSSTMIYYRVYIDGVEAGRTISGLSRISLEYSTMLKSGTYHLVRLERWSLNHAQKSYIRDNNVRQPKPVRIFVPENRVLRLLLQHNDDTYSIRSSLLYK